MISNALRRLVDDVIDKRRIDEENVKELARNILADGARNREEIDVLVALDRATPQSCEGWAEWLIATAVDFAVWTSRPTGVIDREKASWLVTTLGMGEGPTATAARIAFEVVREAERCDEMLLTFALKHGEGSSKRTHASTGINRAVLVS